MYKYTDRSGQGHFVDSQSKIPQEYRDRQEEVRPVRNESSAVVPAAPAKNPQAVQGAKPPAGEAECTRKREQIERDIAENQKKAAQWEKEHTPAGTDKAADPVLEKAAQKAIEKCLGGNLDPARAMEAIQANQSCIAQVTKEENAAADEKSENPYVRRVKSSRDELDRLKTKCGS